MLFHIGMLESYDNGIMGEGESRQNDKMIRNYQYLKLNSKWNVQIHIPLCEIHHPGRRKGKGIK